MAYNNIRIRQVISNSGIITSGTTVVGSPTGTNLPLDTTASPISFSQVSYLVFSSLSLLFPIFPTISNPVTPRPRLTNVPKSIPSTSAPLSTSASPSPTDINPPTSVVQPIPVRTLVAICVAAFILVAGLVIFVLWFGARARKNKLGERIGSNSGLNGDVNGLGYMKNNLGDMDGTTAGTTEEVHLKGIPTNNTSYIHSGGPPLKGGLASEHSSYYSQQTMARNPSQTITQYNAQHAHRPTADSFERQQPVYTIPANYSATSYADEPSFLPKQNVYNRNDMAPVSPRSANIAMAARPPPHSDTTSQSSPRSQSAQAIVRPYAVGAHPYASSHIRTASIEHQGNYTVATALPEPEAVGLGLSGHYYSSSQNSAYAGSSSAMNGTFAKAGARPGYDAYGIESKQPPTHSHSRSNSNPQPYSQQAGRQPIQSISARPSLESIRSIARKASIDRTAAEVAAEFVFGGPQAVGTTSRSRNNSIDSSAKGRAAVAGSQYSGYAPGGGAGYSSSARSGKEGRGGKGDKEKIGKSEKRREMEAMDNLIAALDESAMRERRRKEALAEAAGLGSATSSSHTNGNGNTNGYGRRSTAGGEESDSSVEPRRRKDVAITGSYPLPPADVFRAAFTGAGRGRGPELGDEIDDEEIERWRRR